VSDPAGAADPTAAADPAGRPPTVAWFHCFAGVAGDMALGSLLDAGADFDEVLALLGRLPFGGWALERSSVLRGGITATRAEVTAADTVVVRTHAHIVGLIAEARLPDRIATRALATFAALARVEARLHGRNVDQVHFHEVGGHDTIVDIVGTVAALEILGVDEVESSPIATGMGMVRSAHGMLPNPAPAVVSLLEGVPTWGRDIPVELTTPTGAALVSTLATAYGPMPPMRVGTSGFGAGSREIDDLPNLTQVVVGTRSAPHRAAVTGSGSRGDDGVADVPRPGGLGGAEADAGQPFVLLEANLDDATGEQLAHAVAAVLEAGAYDAWLTPVIMKKGRPGTVVSALCDPVAAHRLRKVLREQTGSLGVRSSGGERWPAARTFDSVLVDGHPIRVKIGGGRVKAEYDDVAAVARQLGSPLREIAWRAESSWQEAHRSGGV